jgi:hypothetical protein
MFVSRRTTTKNHDGPFYAAALVRETAKDVQATVEAAGIQLTWHWSGSIVMSRCPNDSRMQPRMSKGNDPGKSLGSAESQAQVAAAEKPKKTLSQGAFSRQLFRLDMALVALVLLLAFFLGSFVASNSDLFLHLGLGGPFGESSRWPHHAWLPSLLLRIVYEPFSSSARFGGAMAVALKALVVVAIAGVLLLMRRRGQSLVLPVVFVGLAVLVMSPRLLLQPFVSSLLLLAVTMYLLTRPTQTPPRALWFVPPLFALWVNVDHWFVLGPIMVALFLLGEWLQGYLRIPTPPDPAVKPQSPPGKAGRGLETMPKRAGRPERIRQLAIVLGAGLGACLVNPWLFRAWTLPPELGYLSVSTINLLPGGIAPAGTMIYRVQQQDPQFETMISPLFSDYWSRSSAGLNVAGLAYFVLLLAGLASFYLVAWQPKTAAPKPRRPSFSVPLAVVFLFFALLSLMVQRLIPLFAVVAGPVAALNLQDYARRLLPASAPLTPKQHNWIFGGRGSALLACLLLVVFAWPGWLHGNTENWRLSHRVRWQVLEDPGILRAADTITLVQQQTGRMQLGISYDLDGGDLLAWPAHHGHKGIQPWGDSRYQLSWPNADAYGKLRKALRDESDALFTIPSDQAQERQRVLKIQKAQQTYARLMLDLGMDYVVLSGCDHNVQTKRLADGLLHQPFWTTLYVDGRTAIFGLNPDYPTTMRFEAMKLDLWHLVPPKGKPANLPQLSFDPQRVPPVPTGPQGSWGQFFNGPPEPSLSLFEAEQFRILFDIEARGMHFRYINALLGMLGVAPIMAGEIHLGGPEITDPQGKKFRKNALRAPYLGPPAAPLLCVRASRNAVVDSPYYFSSYMQLVGTTYLVKAQEDHWAQINLPTALRAQFRQAVLATGLDHAAILQPYNAQIHEAFVKMYDELKYFDLMVEHFIKLRQGIDEAKVSKEQLEGLDNHLKQLNDQLKRKRDTYKANVTTDMDAVEKFELSLFGNVSKPGEPLGPKSENYLGLAKQGLKFLQEAKVDQLPLEQQKKLFAYQFFVLLATGQAKQAQERLKADLRGQMDKGLYEQMHAVAAAALGDYLAADKYLAEAEQQVEKPATKKVIAAQMALKQEAALQQAGLLAQMLALPPVRSAMSVVIQKEAGAQLNKIAAVAIRAAEFRLMRGILKLEIGDTGAAAEHLRAVLAMVPADVGFPDRAIAKRYLELLE